MDITKKPSEIEGFFYLRNTIERCHSYKAKDILNYPMFARVSFPISSFKTFIYKIPPSLNRSVQPGTCVNAPINKRLQTGFVISISSNSGYKGKY